MSEWLPIESAPEKFAHVLALAWGVQNTGPMYQVAYYCCPEHSLMSSVHPNYCQDNCAFSLQPTFGVPYTHWMPLPAPPSQHDIQPQKRDNPHTD